MGWPSDLTLYKLFTDWGSLLGGVFALIAGGAAYIAGYLQAKATRQAASSSFHIGEEDIIQGHSYD